MTFAGTRCASGMALRRALELGGDIPVMESTADAGGGDDTTKTVTAPAGIVEGDVLFCGIGIDGNGSQDQVLTPPSDTTPWIELDQGATPNGWAVSGLWYKVVTAVAEPASYMWTSNQPQVWAILIWRVSGCDTADPIADWSVVRRDGAIGGDNDEDAPFEAITTRRTNSLLLHLLSTDNNIGIDSITEPGDTEVVDIKHVHGGSSGTWHGCAHEDFPEGGGTGPRVWTLNRANFAGLEERCTHLIALQPPVETPTFLLLEDGVSLVILEDDSGNLKLE